MVRTTTPPANPRLDDAYEQLRSHLPPTELVNAIQTAARLYMTLAETGAGLTGKVLVAYGGGKDSSYALAFVRAVQLILFRIYGTTFSLRVVTNRHAGMPQSVMDNIERVCRALGLFDDRRCELLLIDGEDITPFRADLPVPAGVVLRNRTDILMTGHRTAGDGRPTFCNACNLSMVKAFGLASAHDGGVDVIITGDSPAEQRAYYSWITRLSRGLGLSRRRTPVSPGFQRMLEILNGISRAYFADIHGADALDPAVHGVPSQVGDRLRFFSIYDDTNYDSGSHWKFLTGFLGFVFDDIAFSFSESDCGNPGLMAHLRGLRAAHRQGRSYAEGVDEYVSFAVGLMHRKDFPGELIDMMRARYAGTAGITRMREMMGRYAEETYDLSEEQLVCMVWSPFIDNGLILTEFLEAERPELVAHTPEFLKLLGGEVPPEYAPELVVLLARMSGLSLAQLRVLYQRTTVGSEGNLLAAILKDDPHKAVIERTSERDGALILEQISGR